MNTEKFLLKKWHAQIDRNLQKVSDKFIENQAPVVQRADNSIKRIIHYPVDSVLCFVFIYPLDSDLSGGKRYPPFEQPDPDV